MASRMATLKQAVIPSQAGMTGFERTKMLYHHALASLITPLETQQHDPSHPAVSR